MYVSPLICPSSTTQPTRLHQCFANTVISLELLQAPIMRLSSCLDRLHTSASRNDCGTSRVGFRSCRRTLEHAARCSSTSTAPATAASSNAATGIVNRLIGRQLLRLDSSRSVVPLLSPVEHQLPFAAALIVHHDSAASHDQPHAAAQHHHVLKQQQQQHSSLVELSYVLSGSGQCTSSSDGRSQHVTAGDSILAVLGEVTFSAGSHKVADLSQTAAADGSSSSSNGIASRSDTSSQQRRMPMWRNMIFRSRQHYVKGQKQQQRRQQQQLVMLQLLLPSELLTGELDHYQPEHLEAVAQQLPWANATAGNARQSSSSSSGTNAHCIKQENVCELLAGAVDLPQQQQQQQSPSARSSNVTPMHSLQQQQQQQQQSPGSSSSSGCVKRALSEVNAFQLPDQTNRLALLFGPHANPVVCISFGVEVFEPGHVTPVHIHSNAHELFFVLAGEGEGVFGTENNRMRIKLSVGDVAVFPPGVMHGLDNASQQQLYCLQMMLPNESFVEWVRSGQAAGALDVAAVQRLAAAASCGGL